MQFDFLDMSIFTWAIWDRDLRCPSMVVPSFQGPSCKDLEASFLLHRACQVSPLLLTSTLLPVNMIACPGCSSLLIGCPVTPPALPQPLFVTAPSKVLQRANCIRYPPMLRTFRQLQLFLCESQNSLNEWPRHHVRDFLSDDSALTSSCNTLALPQGLCTCSFSTGNFMFEPWMPESLMM